MQKIDVYFYRQDCPCGEEFCYPEAGYDPPLKHVTTYFEAWFVSETDQIWFRRLDEALKQEAETDSAEWTPKQGDCGGIVQSGEIRFYYKSEDINPAEDPAWKAGRTYPFKGFPGFSIKAGGIPSTDQEPKWWNKGAAKEEAPAFRKMYAIWRCCGKDGENVRYGYK